jgi:hypothetical protein
MQSDRNLQRLTSAVTVHNQQPAQSNDQGIWIRIPTGVLRLCETDQGAPPPRLADQPAVDGSSALATAPSLSEPATARAVFRPRGHMREFDFEGRSVCLRDIQGFRLYAEVLARPHTRIPVVELRAGLAGQDTAMFAGSSGPMVTAAALADLRRSYEDLSEELADAEMHNDLGKARRLHEELETLTKHVSRVMGKDGKPREVSDAERARVAVAKAMTRARKALKIHHPALLEHLLRTVQTGRVWCYQPDRRMVWDMDP